jgi:hypothetical protein
MSPRKESPEDHLKKKALSAVDKVVQAGETTVAGKAVQEVRRLRKLHPKGEAGSLLEEWSNASKSRAGQATRKVIEKIKLPVSALGGAGVPYSSMKKVYDKEIDRMVGYRPPKRMVTLDKGQLLIDGVDASEIADGGAGLPGRDMI